MRIVVTALAAIVFFVLTILILTPLGAGIEGLGIPLVFAGAAIVSAICAIAPTGRRAWGRGLLLDGILLIAAPLLILPLIRRSFIEVTDRVGTAASSDLEIAATNVGAGLGSAVAFGATTFLGFLLGTIFIILGLVMTLGGRREVIFVERRPNVADVASGELRGSRKEPTFRSK